MGIVGKIKRVDGLSKSVRLGINFFFFENITEEYGDATSAELSFASTDAETVSPMRQLVLSKFGGKSIIIVLKTILHRSPSIIILFLVVFNPAVSARLACSLRTYSIDLFQP